MLLNSASPLSQTHTVTFFNVEKFSKGFDASLKGALEHIEKFNKKERVSYLHKNFVRIAKLTNWATRMQVNSRILQKLASKCTFDTQNEPFTKT